MCGRSLHSISLKIISRWDRRIATTLTYGVRIDTNNLSRGVSKLDIEMLYRMFDECDYEVIHMLENSNLCFDDLMAYSSAISSIEVYDDISFCNTGKVVRSLQIYPISCLL